MMLQRPAAGRCLPVMLPLLPSQQTASHDEGTLLLHCPAFPPALLPLRCRRRYLAPPAAADFEIISV